MPASAWEGATLESYTGSGSLEDRRGSGLGTRLFLQASKLLGDVGAQTMLLFVEYGDSTEREQDR